jgi:hypothetical protein
MVGGLATSFLMELIVYPVLYERWKSRGVRGVLASQFSIHAPLSLPMRTPGTVN